MKNCIKLFGIIALTAVIVFSMAACKGKNSSAPADVSSAVSSGSDSNSIDSLLADYEKFVDEYVSVMQSGDLPAAADAEKLAADASEWATRWADVSESDITPAQALKMQELTAKIMSLDL